MPLQSKADLLAFVGKLVVVVVRDAPAKLDWQFVGVVRDLSDTARHLVLTEVEESFLESEESEVPIVVRHSRFAVPLETIWMIDPTHNARYRTTL